MKCRRALASDYEELCRWWKAHGWDAVPLDILPEGFVVEGDDGVLHAAGFVYKASCVPVAYFEYVVTNPDNSARESYKALDVLFEKVMWWVEASLIKACFARMTQESLARMYKRHGFTEGDKAMKDMLWLS